MSSCAFRERHIGHTEIEEMNALPLWASPRKILSSGFREIQTSLLSYRDYIESWNFACSKFGYDTFQQKAQKNKGADQHARMCRVVCSCVVRNTPKTGFLASRPNKPGVLLGDTNLQTVCPQILLPWPDQTHGSITIWIIMKNTIQQPLKRKWTGPIYEWEIPSG